MKPIRIAIAGFRHMHIFDLYQRILDRPDLELVATCEENYAQSLLPGKGLTPDFTCFEKFLAETECEVIALGDAYGKRGAQAIAALRAGKHVIADKPLCTSLAELEELQELARDNNRQVGLMLDLRDHANWITLRSLVHSGRIGEVQTISFSGQHPLLPNSRPAWYFEPGMHGGTFNDIAIHAVDFIPWLTGLEIDKIVAARTWHAKATHAPHFQDCAQLMLRLSNGGGVLGDVSYLAPDGCGYTIPPYWRVTIHGTRGMAETSYNASGVTLADDLARQPEIHEATSARPGGYLDDFLSGVRGENPLGGLDSAACFAASLHALMLEAAARDAQPLSNQTI
jgi:predicted dehydrogenase